MEPTTLLHVLLEDSSAFHILETELTNVQLRQPAKKYVGCLINDSGTEEKSTQFLLASQIIFQLQFSPLWQVSKRRKKKRSAVHLGIQEAEAKERVKPGGWMDSFWGSRH